MQTPAETVTAVNTAIGEPKAAAAARRLQSGDTVITFHGPAARYIATDNWVQKAFGDNATISKRIYSVMIKGMPTECQRIDRETLCKEIGEENSITAVRANPM